MDRLALGHPYRVATLGIKNAKPLKTGFCNSRFSSFWRAESG